jgi:hypothetical protein
MSATSQRVASRPSTPGRLMSISARSGARAPRHIDSHFGRPGLSDQVETVGRVDDQTRRGADRLLIVHEKHTTILGFARTSPSTGVPRRGTRQLPWFTGVVSPASVLCQPENNGTHPLVDVLFETEVELGEDGVDVLLHRSFRQI